MKSKIDITLEIILILVLFGLAFEGIYLYYHWPRGDGSNKLIKTQETELVNEELVKTKQSPKETPPKEITLPDSFALDIPFFSQAPLGNWNPPFDHACEEAAILMVHYYLQGKTTIDPIEVAQEIRDITNFENKSYGFNEDTSAEQTAQLIRDYYGYKVQVYYDVSLEDIKKELVKGNPVIVPTAGRLLGNPYFTPPGPMYHMLVVKGYTQTEFITNDPGTKRGADYVYSYQTLRKAIHDWNNGDVENGKSAMIPVQK